MTKLYEIKHPYYCNEGNYFGRDTVATYSTWGDFFASEGGADDDLNLVFRWDWQVETDDMGERAEDCRSARDPYYRGETLALFYMGQRKGLYRCALVSVCRADEPEIRAWLAARWEHMRRLWAPLSGMSKAEAEGGE